MSLGRCFESALHQSFLTQNALFLNPETLILNRWHDNPLKTFKPRKQVEELISNHYYGWRGKSMKYVFTMNVLKYFFWAKQTFRKVYCKIQDEWEMVSALYEFRSAMKTKTILSWLPIAKTKPKSQLVLKQGSKLNGYMQENK